MPIRSSSFLLPLATQSAASGFASPAEEYAETRINLNEHLIAHPEASFILKTVGNALNHLGIFEGDYLVIDKSLKPAHQNIIIVILNGQLTVKQILKTPATSAESISESALKSEWRLQGGLETKAIPLTKHTQIWGVVKWVLHKV